MSQPPHQPAPADPPPGSPPPAAPTRIGFPGQLQALAPQPQYAPGPGQQQFPQLASGFPDYVSPPPSPPDRTSLVVGSVVVAVVLLFAVLGFAIVA